MGLASFNRMRLRHDENMKASNVLKAKEENKKLEEVVKEAKTVQAEKEEERPIRARRSFKE